MTRWLQAAIQAREPKAKTDETDETPVKVERAGQAAQPQPVLSVVSVSSGGREPETAPACQSPAPSAPAVPFHEEMVRLAWSGEWVSGDRGDALSDLERHGPRGVLFCGNCWRPRSREVALACLDGGTCP